MTACSLAQRVATIPPKTAFDVCAYESVALSSAQAWQHALSLRLQKPWGSMVAQDARATVGTQYNAYKS